MPSRQNEVADVEEFLNKAPAFAIPIARELRAIIREALPKAEERIRWGNPCYKINGLICSISTFKAHVNLVFFRGAEIENSGDCFEKGTGKLLRTMKFTALEQVKGNVLKRLLKSAEKVDQSEKIAPPKKSPPPSVQMPKELSKALAADKTAKQRFEQLSGSCRREYFTWIEEAKRETTRQERVQATVSMVKQGKTKRDKWT